MSNVHQESVAMICRILAYVFILTLVADPAFASFYVSPAGNDKGSGKQTEPFATLAKARDAMRQSGAAKETVLLPGTHRLTAPLELDARDSGQTYRAATGANVVVSGGRRITGWKKAEGGLWRAELPDAEWNFRQLFVNGQRAIRARTPNVASKQPWNRLAGSHLAKDRSSWELTCPPSALLACENVKDVEVVILGNWEITRKTLSAIDPGGGRIVLAPPHIEGHSHIRPKKGSPFFLENAREFLDEPGEWYLDRQQRAICYLPREGENPATAVVMAPVLEQLVTVSGTADRPAEDIVFEGITFSHTNWHPPEHGFSGMQAAFHYLLSPDNRRERLRPTPAVHLRYVRKCRIADGTFTQLGAIGPWLGEGCRENTIEGNDVHDVAANGIMVGEDVRGHNWEEEPELPEEQRVIGNVIRRNHVHSCGTEYFGSVGIWVGFTDGTVVAHNLVHDVPYTGVSFGGMIRNVRLYSRALSESELKANATVEKAPIRDGLVREWPMPEATAADWAANVIAEAGL